VFVSNSEVPCYWLRLARKNNVEMDLPSIALLICMKQMVEYLNIPALSKDIELAITDHFLYLINSIGYVTTPSIIDEVVGYYKNIVERKTFINFRLPDVALELKFREYILTYFGEEKFPIIIAINNTKTCPAIFPPHNDYRRIIAFNYILVEGGNNVTTSFYNGPPVDRLNNKFYTMHKLQLIDQERIDIGRWHTFNAQCIHSVENLLNTRIVLAIVEE
jgi:hypothetical protein